MRRTRVHLVCRFLVLIDLHLFVRVVRFFALGASVVRVAVAWPLAIDEGIASVGNCRLDKVGIFASKRSVGFGLGVCYMLQGVRNIRWGVVLATYHWFFVEDHAVASSQGRGGARQVREDEKSLAAHFLALGSDNVDELAIGREERKKLNLELLLVDLVVEIVNVQSRIRLSGHGRQWTGAGCSHEYLDFA